MSLQKNENLGALFKFTQNHVKLWLDIFTIIRSPRPYLPQESRIFHLLGQFIPRLHKIQCAGQLIGMECGDSSRNSTSLKTPQSGYYLSKLLCSLVPRKHAPKRY